MPLYGIQEVTKRGNRSGSRSDLKHNICVQHTTFQYPVTTSEALLVCFDVAGTLCRNTIVQLSFHGISYSNNENGNGVIVAYGNC